MGCSSLFTHVLSVLNSKVPCSLHLTFFCYSSPCCYIRRYILLRGIEVTLVRIVWPKMASKAIGCMVQNERYSLACFRLFLVVLSR